MGLTYDEQRAILEYKSSGSYTLNDELRRGEQLSSEDMKFKDDVNKAIDKIPSYTGTVYRNIEFRDRESFNKFINEHKGKNNISYPYFISTSKIIDGYNLNTDFIARYEIESVNGKDIEKYGLEDEREVLFKTDTQFLIDVFDVNGNTVYIKMKENEKNATGNGTDKEKGIKRAAESGSSETEYKRVYEEIHNKNDILREGSTDDDDVFTEQSASEGERNSYRTDTNSGTDTSRDRNAKISKGVANGLNADDNIKRYLDGKTNLQKGNISKELNKTFSTDEYGSITTAEFIQRSFDDGKALIENKNIKSSIVKAKNEFVFGRDIEKIFRKNSKKYHDIGVNNFAFAKEARELNITKQGGEHIKTIDPKLYYYIIK